MAGMQKRAKHRRAADCRAERPRPRRRAASTLAPGERRQHHQWERVGAV